MAHNKVFCIGSQKTGTSSMGRALSVLGYRVCGAVGLADPNLEDNIRSIAADAVPNYDAFQDNPWPILFRELDRDWPGSKFILTLRDEQNWLRSVLRHFGSEAHPMQQWVYGVGYPKGNEDIFLERYRRHNEEVKTYFRDRPDDLLIVNIESGELWEPICKFLSHDVPVEAFPHANKGGPTWKFYRWLSNRAKRVLARLGLSKS